MTLALQNKIAVITGGSSGIGLAIAKHFVLEGAQVFITGRRQDQLDNAVSEIGRQAIGVRGDVSNLEDLDALYTLVASKASAWRSMAVSPRFSGCMPIPL